MKFKFVMSTDTYELQQLHEALMSAGLRRENSLSNAFAFYQNKLCITADDRGIFHDSDFPVISFQEALDHFKSLQPKPTFNFKPFDKILRRSDRQSIWQIGIYSHVDAEHPCFQGLNSSKIEQLIAAESNMHLLGTNKLPADGWWIVNDKNQPEWRTK